jgi:hypothetical protein
MQGRERLGAAELVTCVTSYAKRTITLPYCRPGNIRSRYGGPVNVARETRIEAKAPEENPTGVVRHRVVFIVSGRRIS